MPTLWRQVGWLLLTSLFWYGLLAVFIASMTPGPPTLDTNLAHLTIYHDPARMVALGRTPLCRTSKPKLLIVGASNTMIGFRPRELGPLLPRYEVHNLSIGASNMTQAHQVVRLAADILPPRVLHRSVFVVGCWYGDMIDNRLRWPDHHTAVDRELLRSGLYADTGDRVREVLPVPLMPYALRALPPVLFFGKLVASLKDVAFYNAVADQMAATVAQWCSAKAPRAAAGRGRPVPARSSKVTLNSLWGTYMSPYGTPFVPECIRTQPKRQALLDFWEHYLHRPDHRLPDEQFRELTATADTTRHLGACLVIVDLPLPSWHRLRSPFYADYQRRKVDYFRQLRRYPGVAIINLQDLGADADFVDSAHPLAAVTHRWSEMLAARWPTVWNGPPSRTPGIQGPFIK